jgi:hypothetical protein
LLQDERSAQRAEQCVVAAQPDDDRVGVRRDLLDLRQVDRHLIRVVPGGRIEGSCGRWPVGASLRWVRNTSEVVAPEEAVTCSST